MSKKKKEQATPTTSAPVPTTPKGSRPRKSFLESLRDDITEALTLANKIRAKWEAISSQSDEATRAIGQTLSAQADTVQALIGSGFVPRIVTKTSPIESDDVVRVAEKYKDRYADIEGADGDLVVVKRQPGKRGQLVVKTKQGPTFLIPVSHVERVL